MLAVIDIGTTHTVIGLYQAEQLACIWRIASDPRRTADEYHVIIEGLFAARGIRSAQVQDAVIASVVASLTPVVQAVFDRFARTVLVLTASTDTGIRIGYDNPAELGMDRLANAVAAFAACRTSLIVIDFGTATTFDYVDAGGCLRGGAIAPGVVAAAESLRSRAHRLPQVALVRPERVIATGTAAGMQSGILYGGAGQAEGIVQRMRHEAGDRARVIATGGLAGVVAPLCPVIDLVDEHLTLKGLKIIFDRQGTKG
jgi:type III pantothenate kinase